MVALYNGAALWLRHYDASTGKLCSFRWVGGWVMCRSMFWTDGVSMSFAFFLPAFVCCAYRGGIGIFQP